MIVFKKSSLVVTSTVKTDNKKIVLIWYNLNTIAGFCYAKRLETYKTIQKRLL